MKDKKRKSNVKHPSLWFIVATDDACCDGSDETSGLIKCPNHCKEAAAEHAKVQAILNKIQAAGAAAKQKLVDQGQKTVSEWEEEKSKLEETLAIKRSFLMRQKSTYMNTIWVDARDWLHQNFSSDEIEALEKDVNKKSKKTKACPPCKASSAASEKIATLKADVQVLQEEIDTLLSILKTMKRDHNHNFHDMAVKAAISGYDEFMSNWEEFKAEIDKDLDFSEDEFAVSEESQEWQEESVDEEEEDDEQVDDLEATANKNGKRFQLYTWLILTNWPRCIKSLLLLVLLPIIQVCCLQYKHG